MMNNDAEKFKESQNFDNQLGMHIFPEHHSMRRVVGFVDQLLVNIRNQVDPCFTEFMLSTALIPPVCVTQKSLTKAKNPFRPTDEFRTFVGEFMHAYLVSKGQIAGKKMLRRVRTQAVVTLVELINRNPLIKPR